MIALLRWLFLRQPTDEIATPFDKLRARNGSGEKGNDTSPFCHCEESVG